jgi:hypothetical protein
VPLPLPYVIGDRSDVQGNFDAISTAWPSQNVGVFSAYRNAALSQTTNQAVVFDAEEYDVSGWHDVTTGKFTPKVAGYYRLSWGLSAAPPAANTIISILAKNAAFVKRGVPCLGNAFSNAISAGTGNVVANGTTDFFQVFFFHNVGGALALVTGVDWCYFQGEMIAV